MAPPLSSMPGVSLRSREWSLCSVCRAGRPWWVRAVQWLRSSSCREPLTAARWASPASLRYRQPERLRRHRLSRPAATWNAMYVGQSWRYTGGKQNVTNIVYAIEFTAHHLPHYSGQEDRHFYANMLTHTINTHTPTTKHAHPQSIPYTNHNHLQSASEKQLSNTHCPQSRGTLPYARQWRHQVWPAAGPGLQRCSRPLLVTETPDTSIASSLAWLLGS